MATSFKNSFLFLKKKKTDFNHTGQTSSKFSCDVQSFSMVMQLIYTMLTWSAVIGFDRLCTVKTLIPM